MTILGENIHWVDRSSWASYNIHYFNEYLLRYSESEGVDINLIKRKV